MYQESLLGLYSALRLELRGLYSELGLELSDLYSVLELELRDEGPAGTLIGIVVF